MKVGQSEEVDGGRSGGGGREWVKIRVRVRVRIRVRVSDAELAFLYYLPSIQKRHFRTHVCA